MSKKRNSDTALVYSTDVGRICPNCERALMQCHCKKHIESTGTGELKIARSTKGRKGKGISVISGFSIPPDEIEKLGKELKRTCGTGGTVKNNCIEIQGDHRDLLLKELLERGFKAKLAGS